MLNRLGVMMLVWSIGTSAVSADEYRHLDWLELLPAQERLSLLNQAPIDHGIKNLVLGFEVIIEIATRYADLGRNIRKGGRLEPLLIKQLIRSFDNPFARALFHDHVCST